MHFQHIRIDVKMLLNMRIRQLLFVVLWDAGVIGNLTYNERTASANSCTYIHVCRFDIVPARSLVECAIKVTHADSGLLFYDTNERTCSICHPTQPGVHPLASGQRCYTGGTFPHAISQQCLYIFYCFLLTNTNNMNYMFCVGDV